MPDWAPHVRPRLSSLRLSPTREIEIIDELSQHLDDRHQELLVGGASSEDALRITLAEFAERDLLARRMSALRQARHREVVAVAGDPFSLTGFWLDLRHTIRELRKDWGFTGIAVLTLALGIGANAAVFSAVHAILLRPLPFKDSSHLVNVWLSRSGRPNWHFHVPPADFAVIQAGNRVFEQMALYDNDWLNLTGGGDPQEVPAGIVSAELFPLLGVQAAVGRLFNGTDEEAGGEAVVILSDGLWRRRFAANPAVLGSSVSLNDRAHRVVGVMPAGFSFPGRAEVWLPRDRSDAQSNAYILARLRPDVGLALAQADMEAMVAAITNGRPNPGMRFTVEPLKEMVTGSAGSSWFLLLAAVACVLAIGCVNISNLILARGLRRQREIDIRLALGASRGHIFRLLATESLLLAAIGGVLALGVASWSIDALRAWAPGDTPRLDELGVEPTMLWVAMGLSMLTAFAFGLVPALQCSRSDIATSLKSASTAATATRGHSRARNVLVVMEIALSVVLLVGATLLVRSLVRLTNVNPGFQTSHLLTVNLHLPPAKYSQPAQRLDFITRTLAGLRSLPGVAAASASSGSVMTGWGLPGAQRTPAQRISREGSAPATSPEEANMRRVDSAYFRTMGMRIVTGRGFADTDRVGTPGVAIVNQVMARTYWGEEPVLGRRLSFERDGGKPVWLEIVGIVNDTRDIALTQAPQPAFFIPLLQNPNGLDLDSLSLYLRTSHDPLATASAVRTQIWTVDANQPVADVSTMDLAVERFVAAPRFRTGLLAGLSSLGLFLALVGIYAVVSYSVNQRTPEIAVRLALGAERRQIVGLVLGQGFELAAAGVALGIGASLVVSRLLGAVLFDIASIDPPTLVGVAALVLCVVLAACYLPARRAAATNAIEALRGEPTGPVSRPSSSS